MKLSRHLEEHLDIPGFTKHFCGIVTYKILGDAIMIKYSRVICKKLRTIKEE